MVLWKGYSLVDMELILYISKWNIHTNVSHASQTLFFNKGACIWYVCWTNWSCMWHISINRSGLLKHDYLFFIISHSFTNCFDFHYIWKLKICRVRDDLFLYNCDAFAKGSGFMFKLMNLLSTLRFSFKKLALFVSLLFQVEFLLLFIVHGFQPLCSWWHLWSLNHNCSFFVYLNKYCYV
jgi:hypothetical protein